MRSTLVLTTVALHVAAAILALFGVVFGFLYSLNPHIGSIAGVIGGGILLVSLGIAACLEYLVRGLNRRARWSFLVGVGVLAVLSLSPLSPAGLIGLYGLIRSRDEFDAAAE